MTISTSELRTYRYPCPRGRGERSGVPLSLLAQQLLVPPRRTGAEILRLVELAQLELDLAISVEHRPFPQPLERFLLRAHLDDRVAGHELLRLGKRPVHDRRLAAVELDPRAVA